MGKYTVGQVSTVLKAYYSFLEQGDYINFYNFSCSGLVYSGTEGDPIQVNDHIDLIKTYKNFKIDFASEETLASKGFIVLLKV